MFEPCLPIIVLAVVMGVAGLREEGSSTGADATAAPTRCASAAATAAATAAAALPPRRRQRPAR